MFLLRGFLCLAMTMLFLYISELLPFGLCVPLSQQQQEEQDSGAYGECCLGESIKRITAIKGGADSGGVVLVVSDLNKFVHTLNQGFNNYPQMPH